MTVKQRVADGDDDPVESMLKKAGCLELHYKVMESINKRIPYSDFFATNIKNPPNIGGLFGSELCDKYSECINTTKDWRKCQDEVTDFKNCVNKHKETAQLKS